MTVRVGFLGAGLISHMHTAFLAASSVDHRIVAVHDPDEARAAAFASRHDARPGSIDEVLESVDAVYVTAWTSEHRSLVGAAAERGVAVFCEKPLAVDAATAAGMIDAVERADVVNQVGLVLRSLPTFIFARRLLRDPAAGRLQAVSFRDDQYIPTQGMYASTWRGDPARAGRGSLLEHSIHDVDLLQWMCGPVATVSATTREFHGLDRIDDVAVARLEFESGGVGSLTSVWHDILERPSMRHIEFFCERLYVVIDDDAAGTVRWQFTGSEAERMGPDDLVDACAGDEAVFTDDTVRVLGSTAFNPASTFLQAVCDGGPSPLPLREALAAHRIVDAAYASADGDGHPVEP
jgi:predicted dehydrogenase